MMASRSLYDAYLEGVMKAMSADHDIFLLSPGMEDHWKTEVLGPMPDGSFAHRSMRGSPSAVLGAAIGASLDGLHPVVELASTDQLLTAAPEVVQQIRSIRTAWDRPVPILITTRFDDQDRILSGASLSAVWACMSDFKIAAPASLPDARGLAITALQTIEPCIFLISSEGAAIPASGDGNSEPTPFGLAAVRRSGADATIIAYSSRVGSALEAAETLALDGIEAEVVDLRTLQPLDVESIATSVRKTNRLIVVGDALLWASGGEPSSVGEAVFDYLDAPVRSTPGSSADAIAGEVRRTISN
jgi:pyruvate dehydrogenase E1 component beta subunit